ncbi:tricorn protease domain 2-containing protein [Eremomyces bilateralis CBS 781.70]|uniref:Tricorn protease domain 2-containing protein n=1 Tax=Eremomyces bilateralis CBS 781.70 TaxID=1392243 RepID=A0A6G1G4I9_9PEZI|nr:tricorn protease domain 2-containing protein [Eremomyces bilateralis CBS 781.70]KAF1813005.1 tricorn protease domain 2-containing protein [Eremomyces bilateralis CBS 781.70]
MGRKGKRKWTAAEEAAEPSRQEQPIKKQKKVSEDESKKREETSKHEVKKVSEDENKKLEDISKHEVKKAKHPKSKARKPPRKSGDKPHKDGENKPKPSEKKPGQLQKKEEVRTSPESQRNLQSQLKELNGALNSVVGGRDRAIGGRFLAIDPIFSADEEYLILATRRSVELYLLADSLLSSKFIVPPQYGAITAVAISNVEPSSMYVATSALRILLWDWSLEKAISIWETAHAVKHIAVVPGKSPEEEALLAVFHLSQKDRTKLTPAIVAKSVKSGDGFIGEPWTVFESSMEITGLKAIGDECLVAVSSRSVAIGEPSKTDQSYTWRLVEVNERISSFDAKSLKVDSKSQLNLALGGEDGIIYSYENILRKLKQTERSIGSLNLAPRLLHWHRGAVGSAKYSNDGKYLISGGKETSLVLWQLDTGSRQILPHLLADIDSVTVSPSGTLYAVALADNSVMVLSTAELQPTAVIASVQSRICHPQTLLDVLRDDSKEKPQVRNFEARTPVVVDPSCPTRVHFAVPLSQWRLDREAAKPASFLQTFDFYDARHHRKQALTRNNTTNPNVNSELENLKEPNVKCLQLTHDGNWMVTVEEWFPSAEQVKYLEAPGDGLENEREIRAEIYLKFWSWDKTDNQWTLITRIDAPHASNDERIYGRVLGLVAHPKRNSVATIGDDGIVRIWKPKTRFRNGTTVRDNANESLVTWTCSSATELEKELMSLDEADVTNTESAINAHLAYSTDGSVLAATQEFDETELRATVHFIDAHNGKIRNSESGLYDYGLVSMAFCGRHLVVLSSSIVVWDVVCNELLWKESIVNGELLSPWRAAPLSHLAASSSGEKFAVAYPVLKSTSAGGFETRIEVFKPGQREAILSESIPAVVSALTPLVASDGFLVLNGYAELRTIGESMSMIPVDAMTRQVSRKDKPQSLAIKADEVDMVEADDDSIMQVDEEPVGDDRPVVRKEQLARVLDGGVSRALPLVKDMFQGFMQLYMRKPSKAS